MPPLSFCDPSIVSDEVFSFTNISEVETRDLLKCLKASNTRDVFGISTNFIKRNISLYACHLVKLINSSFKSGEFPDKLKEARVVPIHKGGDVDDINNYRPISILPAFSKVFERAIYNRIVGYVESVDCLFVNQFGFRRGRSTADAVNEFTRHCLSTFESGEYCVSLFLDLSRAFDCVSHEILLQKLENVYKFDKQSLKLVESYLKNRTQRVLVGDKQSAGLVVDRGVPQGSILGPLLFLLFFNDFPYFIERDSSVVCIAYADDATLMVRGKNLDEVVSRSDEVLERVRLWSVANQLSLNEGKTVRMAFSLREIDIENPESTRFLGVCVAAP